MLDLLTRPVFTPPHSPSPHAVDHGNVMLALAGHARMRPNALALQIGSRALTQAQLHAGVSNAANYLHRQGVAEGATVALLLSDPVDLALGVLALMHLGATPMALAPTTPLAQLQDMLTEANATWLLADPGADWPVAALVLPLSEHLIAAPAALAPRTPPTPCVRQPAAACLLITGSGTTGKPRLMPVTHAQMRVRLAMQQTRYAVAVGERMMVVTPLHFSVSIHNMLAALFAGGTALVWDQTGSLAHAVATMRPDVLSLTMMHAEELLALRQHDAAADLGAVRVVTITSSAISEALRQRLRNTLNARLHIVYGTNEVYSVTVAYPQDLDEIAAGIGRADHGVQVEVVNHAGEVLANGEVGEIRVQTPAQIDGYLHGVDAERFRGGWFYPGDLARWAPCGQLVLMGRSDEMMIMKGVNIYPAEIELALLDHPAVHEVAAFAFNHPLAQELPVCVVALRPGERRSRSELMAFARERLGPKTPRVVAITPAIARTVQGKLLRPQLTAAIDAALAHDAPPSAQRAQAFIAQCYAEQKHSAAVQPGHATPHPHPHSHPNPNPNSRQRKRRVGFDFVLPAWPRLAEFRPWRLALEGSACDANADEAPLDLEVSHMAVLWVSEILFVMQTLLQAARVPMFAQHQLLSCQPARLAKAGAGTGWHAEVEFPWVDGLAPDILGTALKAALLLENWSREHHTLCATDAQGRDAFFAFVEQRALEPLRKLLPGGKSTVHVLRAAYASGVPFAHLGGGIYQLGWGAMAHRISRSSTEHDAAMGIMLTHRKDLTAQLLRDAGLPGADHAVASTVQAARTAAARIGWPLVVKPADADRGEGVQVDVGADNLDAAFALAQQASPSRRVLVERQINGTCHRVFVAGGTLLYAVKRLPAGLYGNGVGTVAELLAFEHSRQALLPPWKRSGVLSLDALALVTLASVGLHADAVPEPGAFVALRRIESSAWGGVDEDVTLTMHPENLRIALAASALCGLDVAGIDLISSDITQPWHANGAVINEVNYAPLLGEGVISRRHVPAYLTRLLGGDGRIPVEVYVGQTAAANAARHRAAALRETGLAAAVTSHDWTEAPDGQPWPLAIDGLHARIRALVLSPGVGAIVVVVQTDALLNRELPLEGVDAVHLVDTAAMQFQTAAPAQRLQGLLRALQAWVWPHTGSHP